MSYDLIIIGGGPAGSAAAIYAARKRLHTLIIAKEFGGQSVVSPEIYNWIGDKAISGNDLAQKFKNHVYEYEGDRLTILTGSIATKLEQDTDGFLVTTDQNETFSGKTILVASGSRRRKLDVPGADEYENRGVVYCASCDGPLFANEDVVVVGGGNAGFETAAQLAAYCKSVTLLHRSAKFKADQITVNKVLEKDNVEAWANTEPVAVLGEQMVTGIKYRNKVDGTEGELPVAGVFVEIGQIPNTDYVKDLVKVDEYNRIEIDPWTQRSSVTGIWAAGDATNVRFHQNNISAGDAVKAVEDIYLYLHAGK